MSCLSKEKGEGEAISMQKADCLLVQNVIGRITHGLIGFDLFLQGKKNNNYLGDFLTLREDELKLALASASAKMGLIPAGIKVSPEEVSAITAVMNAQRVARKIDKVSSGEIERIITDLERKLDLFYRSVRYR